MQKIYSLKLGESIVIPTEVKGYTNLVMVDYIITRVPGGWLFKKEYKDSTPVFVPFNNEFLQ